MSENERARPALRALSANSTLLAIAPFLGYLFAYNFNIGYLGFFGFDRAFSRVGIESVLLSVALLVSVIYFAFQILMIIPVRLLEFLAKAAYIHNVDIMVALLLLSSFLSAGFSWLTVFLAFLFLFIFTLQIITYVRAFCGGKTFNDVFQGAFSDDIKVREKFAGPRIIDAAPFLIVFLISLLFFSPAIGQYMGAKYAERKLSHQVYSDNDGEYAVVFFEQGVLGMARFERGAERVGELSRETRLMDVGDGPISLQRVVIRLRWPEAPPRNNRVTFSQFLDRLTNALGWE